MSRLLERESFIELVRQALGLIYDRGVLQAHPLCSVLALSGVSLDPDALRRAMVDAIQQLRPAQLGPHPTSQWRRYRYLWLRYVERAPLDEIAKTLGVTDRQARRDHREGLEAVAAILWTSFLGTPWPAQDPDGEDLSKHEVRTEQDREASALETELSKVATGQPRGPTSLPDTVDGVLQTASRLIGGSGKSLEVEIPEDLPMVTVSRAILRQIVLSLLAYVTAVSSGRRLRLTATADETTVELVVSCVGECSGLEAAELQQPDGEEGLRLVQRMVEREGATVAVRSLEDGVMVSLRLPSARVTTVLVVDDNLDFLRLCQRYLEGGPYRVLTANLASEALRLANEVQPDVLILDALMPNQDGWDLLAALQRSEATRKIPVVVCSVLKEPSLALRLGAAYFLPKPVTLVSLLAALEHVVAEPRADQGLPAGNP